MSPFRRADDVLRGRPAGRPWGLVLACGLAYGAVMGTFGGIEGDRPWQVAFSAIKLPLLLATLGLSLPGFFDISTLPGVSSVGIAMAAASAWQSAIGRVLPLGCGLALGADDFRARGRGVVGPLFRPGPAAPHPQHTTPRPRRVRRRGLRWEV